MPSLSIICSREENSRIIKKHLQDAFGKLIDISCQSIEAGFDSLDADVALVSMRKNLQFVSARISANTQVMLMQRTISRAGWDKIISIPATTRALLVNDREESTYETLTLLYELGVKQLNLVPYHPGIPHDESIKLAITPNEAHLVPDSVEKIIDIGDRVLDSHCVFDLVNKLGILDQSGVRECLSTYLETIMSSSPAWKDALRHVTEGKQYLQLVLDVVDEGIIAYDANNNITLLNKICSRIFNKSSWEIQGLHLKKFFSQRLQSLLDNDTIKDQTFSINNTLYIVNKYSIPGNNEILGGILSFRECTEIERLEEKIRQSTRKKGYIAKYAFSDIEGGSESIANAMAIAKRMARSDGALLIQGESGTGKELFAQAIHTQSNRREHPFVAFNCAVVPDALIESELFGYEEGAFTGARKGGKAGLFELAHRGSIFLDEIGDISPSMQAKLLRVLQEREIVRVGGTTVKPVDLRVIAATNKDLKKLMRQGEFRNDLYYRLCALQLHIPPLRERIGDIPRLLKYFIERCGRDYVISSDALSVLESHFWPGNVRELENCVEYLVNIVETDTVGKKDLPPGILSDVAPGASDETSEPLLREGNAEDLLAIMETINEYTSKGRKVGRREISRKLQCDGSHLTEQEVRTRLHTLREMGYVDIHSGRAGTKLTAKGKLLLKRGEPGIHLPGSPHSE